MDRRSGLDWPWAHRRVFPGTFEVRGEVFRRAGRDIDLLFGPNLAVEALRGETLSLGAEKFADVFPERLAHEIQRVLSRKGRGGGRGG